MASGVTQVTAERRFSQPQHKLFYFLVREQLTLQMVSAETGTTEIEYFIVSETENQ